MPCRYRHLNDNFWRMGCSYSFKVSLPQISPHCKGKKVTLPCRRQPLNHVIHGVWKGTKGNCLPPSRKQQTQTASILQLLPKVHHVNEIRRKQKPKRRHFLLNNWPLIFKSTVKSRNLEQTRKLSQTGGGQGEMTTKHNTQFPNGCFCYKKTLSGQLAKPEWCLKE